MGRKPLFNRDHIKVTWQDIKVWNAIFDLTFMALCRKFAPHFYGFEEDLKQEMMIALIGAIKRIKNGEIKSEKNYVITCMKYRAFRIAKKLIEYDKNTIYLNDYIPKSDKYKNSRGWDWMVSDSSTIDFDLLVATLENPLEQYVFMLILEMDGYSRTDLKETFNLEWEDIPKLEHEVKEKIIEILRAISGDHIHG